MIELTEREQEVLEQIGRGLSYNEIAVELGISPKTVEVYASRIDAKLPAGVDGSTRYTRLILYSVSWTPDAV